MNRIRGWVVVMIAALATSCASTPDPVLCAQIGLGLGAGGGAVGASESREGNETGRIIGFGIAGAVVGAGAGYLICKLLEEDEPEPVRRAAPAPPPPAPAPAPEPVADPCAQVIRLRGVQFDFDQAVLRAESAVVLDEAALLLGDALAQCPKQSVSVEGHTDATGPESYNQVLSEGRARAVRDHLVRQGIDASRLSLVGYGESQPIAGNDTRDGRELNRRVELRLVR